MYRRRVQYISTMEERTTHHALESSAWRIQFQLGFMCITHCHCERPVQ